MPKKAREGHIQRTESAIFPLRASRAWEKRPGNLTFSDKTCHFPADSVVRPGASPSPPDRAGWQFFAMKPAAIRCRSRGRGPKNVLDAEPAGGRLVPRFGRLNADDPMVLLKSCIKSVSS